ncbi:exodeoxyribonuclease I [Candidatus Saccharibacteria bacterium]|nr:exodeoxyribonuclease I [Candidatus Saccharibacteria bacterium]
MAQQTFFFYDLETSGLSPREDRIMQFAGQRTTLDFKPLGEPVNLLIKLSDDTLPSPGAIMVTGITPQATLADGVSEAEFCKYAQEEIFTPDTISLGYNTVRFDDEFIRHLFWRNFYDPYEWQWQDGRSRWDLLDVVRITRALRPDGINWPETKDGQPTNRLELITKLNGISHENAHDALADVTASIEVAKLLKSKQPQLFDYLFKMRDKKKVQKLINLDDKQPFVYTSGRYGKEHNFTTVAFPLAPAKNGNILVYDLRHNVEDNMNPDCYPIVKTLQYNRCPAVAPLGVLNKNDGWSKIGLTEQGIKDNLAKLLKHPEFAEQVRDFHENREDYPPAPDVESALYDGFLPDNDRTKCNAVRNADTRSLADFHPDFTDERLAELLVHYKARNFKTSLTEDEAQSWETYRRARLDRQAPKFTAEIAKFQQAGADDFLLEELELWYQSLLPEDI